MSSETDPILNNNNKKLATSFRWTLLRAKRRLPTVRLGCKTRRRGFFLVRLCRKVKLKWLRIKYLCMLEKLKKYYDSFVKDMIERSSTIESYQQTMLLETSFAIPVTGLGFNSYPSNYGIDRPYF